MWSEMFFTAMETVMWIALLVMHANCFDEEGWADSHRLRRVTLLAPQLQ